MIVNSKIEIIRAQHRGICCGVATALFIAEKTLKQYPNQPVYMIGDLIHNNHAINKLRNDGLITLGQSKKKIYSTSRDLVMAVPDKSIIILSAHGSGASVYNAALKKNLVIVDTTCVFVNKTHTLVRNSIKNDKWILFVGKKNHAETRAILEIGGKRIFLIESKKCITDFYYDNKHNLEVMQNLVLTNQTTLSALEFRTILHYALELMPKIKHYDEICDATTLRQLEIYRHINKEIDLALIVGDPNSNNACKLLEICQTVLCKKSILVSSVVDISHNLLLNVKKIFITASASTTFKSIFDIENKLTRLIQYKNNS